MKFKFLIFVSLLLVLTGLLSSCGESNATVVTVISSTNSPTNPNNIVPQKTTASIPNPTVPVANSVTPANVATIPAKITVINRGNIIWDILSVKRYSPDIIATPITYKDGGSNTFIAVEINLQNQDMPITASAIQLYDNKDIDAVNLLIREKTSFDILNPPEKELPRTILVTFQISSNATDLSLYYPVDVPLRPVVAPFPRR